MLADTQGMRDLRQWLVWRSEERDGKPTKIPYSPLTGQRASSTTPETWTGYEEAVRACKKHGYGGIGFVFTPEDDLCGVDLDGCLDAETGEIEPWAQEVIEGLDSYTEVSPSGTGVHVLVRGELPAGRNRKGRFEAYDRGRYFTVTGRHLAGTPRTVESRQEELRGVVRRVFGSEAPESANGHTEPVAASVAVDNGLSDTEVVEKASASRNGEKFRRLWAGDTSDYGSHSEADLALCGKLAFWTGGDATRVDSLFRQSDLYRKKWDRKDYRNRTITEALSGKTEFYEPPKTVTLYIDRDVGTEEKAPKNSVPASPSPYRDKDTGTIKKPKAVRFADMDVPGPREYLLENLVLSDYPTLWHGDGGVAKSLLVLSMGVAISGGSRRWLGKTVEKSRVLYVDFELDAGEQSRRVHQLCQGAGLSGPPEDLLYMSALGYSAREAFTAALEACEERTVGLVILDSLGPALQGDAEASRDVIAFFQQAMEPFREQGVGVLIIDHQSKMQGGQSYQSKGAFGSVYKNNLARSVVQVEATERGEGTLTVRLRQKKHNFGPLTEPFGATLTFTEESVTLEPVELMAAELAEEATLNAAERVKLALEDSPAYPWEIAEFTGLAVKTVKNTLTGLRKQGAVEATGEIDGRAEQVRLVSVPIVPMSSNIRDGDIGTMGEDNTEGRETRQTNNVPTSQFLIGDRDGDDETEEIL